jgi:hypothetical protein
MCADTLHWFWHTCFGVWFGDTHIKRSKLRILACRLTLPDHFIIPQQTPAYRLNVSFWCPGLPWLRIMSTVFLLGTVIPMSNVYIVRRIQPACAPEQTLNSNFRFKLSVPENTVPSTEIERTLNANWRFKLSVPQNTVSSAETERTLHSYCRFKLRMPKPLCLLLTLIAHWTQNAYSISVCQKNTVPSAETASTLHSNCRFKFRVPKTTVPSADIERTLNSNVYLSSVCPKKKHRACCWNWTHTIQTGD